MTPCQLSGPTQRGQTQTGCHSRRRLNVQAVCTRKLTHAPLVPLALVVRSNLRRKDSTVTAQDSHARHHGAGDGSPRGRMRPSTRRCRARYPHHPTSRTRPRAPPSPRQPADSMPAPTCNKHTRTGREGRMMSTCRTKKGKDSGKKKILMPIPGCPSSEWRARRVL